MTRTEDKQKSRDEDQRRLDSGEITKAELSKENSFFGSLNIVSLSIINRRHRIHLKDDTRRTS